MCFLPLSSALHGEICIGDGGDLVYIDLSRVGSEVNGHYCRDEARTVFPGDEIRLGNRATGCSLRIWNLGLARSSEPELASWKKVHTDDPVSLLSDQSPSQRSPEIRGSNFENVEAAWQDQNNFDDKIEYFDDESESISAAVDMLGIDKEGDQRDAIESTKGTRPARTFHTSENQSVRVFDRKKDTDETAPDSPVSTAITSVPRPIPAAKPALPPPAPPPAAAPSDSVPPAVLSGPTHIADWRASRAERERLGLLSEYLDNPEAAERLRLQDQAQARRQLEAARFSSAFAAPAGPASSAAAASDAYAPRRKGTGERKSLIDILRRPPRRPGDPPAPRASFRIQEAEAEAARRRQAEETEQRNKEVAATDAT